MVLSQNHNLSQCLKPVSRIGRLSLISRSRHRPSVSNGVVAIAHNPKHRRSKVLQTLDAIGKRSMPKLRPHRMIHTGFYLFVVFLSYCLLFFSLAGCSSVMQQKSSLEMQLAIFFLTLLLSTWPNLHSVFRRTKIAGFFLGLFFLELLYF